MSAAEELVKDDLRGELEAAFNEPEVEAPEVETEEQKEERARDEKGRFVAKTTEEPPEVEEPEKEPESTDLEAATPTEEVVEEPTALAPPNGWTAEAKAKWHELPEEVQQAAIKREEDVHKQISKHDEERNFGREMHRAVSPYMAQIQAEGGTPAGAVQQLLNTAYILRVGSPEQKKQLLLQTARQFGVDMSQPETNEDIPPFVNPLIQRLDRLEGHLTQSQQAEQQRLQDEVRQEIQAFAADPTHTHFTEVKAHMAALLREGAAKDVQDAYEQACWASPDIRATLQAQERVKEEQKRKADAKARAEQSKRKAGITGGPGGTATKSAPESTGSVRDDLQAAFAAQSSAV